MRKMRAKNKGRPTYDFSNPMVSGKRVVVNAAGLKMGASTLKASTCILVTVNQTSPRRKWEREFVYWCGKLDLQVRICRPKAEAFRPTRESLEAAIRDTGSAVFEVYGEVPHLDGFRQLPCVWRWEWMVSGGPSTRIVQQGAGPEKVKANRPKGKPEVVYFPTEIDRGARELPVEEVHKIGNQQREGVATKYTHHKDAMGKMVKGVATLSE